MSSRRVVLAGWGQVTQGKEEPLDRVHDPIGLMAGASRQAFEMCGASDVSGSLDGVMVVKVMSANYASADQCLAETMGITPRFSMTSKIGGNSPQSLINKAAGMIARGELDSVLITGAEAYYPRDKSRQFHGNRLFQGFSSDYEEDDIIGATELEAHHGMSLPIQGFPLMRQPCGRNLVWLWVLTWRRSDHYGLASARLRQLTQTHGAGMPGRLKRFLSPHRPIDLSDFPIPS